MAAAPRVGSAAWNAARLAWRDVATASARALIARRVDGLRRDASEASTFLEAGTHEVPTACRGSERLPAFPPGRDREPPEHRRQRHRRHVVDGVWPAERCGVLASYAASALAPLRDRHGEASVAALGFASREILGDAAFVDMRGALAAMRREAERVFTFGTVTETDQIGSIETKRETGDGNVRRLYPAGALLTHIVPAAKQTKQQVHGYWSPHVDKANVPEYDVSAILYLSDGTPEPRDEEQRRTRALLTTDATTDIPAAEFSGGTLDFLDDDDDAARLTDVSLKQKETHTTFLRRVTPRRGRLVVFASGEENVHAVGSVTSGARATLNLWLTFDEGLEVKL
jgi:hypothetical protein